MLWNVCICLWCSKHFLSLFPIHTLLVFASHWRLQLITVHASKITIKIFLLQVELHNSLYELCSTSCAVALTLHLYPPHGFANRMVPAQPEGPGRALPVREMKSMGWRLDWEPVSSLQAPSNVNYLVLLQGLRIPSTQHSSWKTSLPQIIESCFSKWLQNSHLLLPCPLLHLVYVLIGEQFGLRVPSE